MDNLVIAISREFGSGGRLVGEKLAGKLGIEFYDKQLIELAAEKSGLSSDFIQSSEEQASSGFFFPIAANAPLSSGYFMHYELPAGDRAFFAQLSVIRELAQKKPCVILGRCAGYILRETPGCVKVFLHGSLDSRLSRAIEVYGMRPKGLADKLVRIDKGRANYHKFYTGENWRDVRLYDLVVNTGSSGIDGAVESIAALIRNRK